MPSMGLQKRSKYKKKGAVEEEEAAELCHSPVALQRSFHFPARPQDIISLETPATI